MTLIRTTVLGGVVALAIATPIAGAHAAVLSPKCPDGYVGVVVDDHDVCTNGVGQCPPGYFGVIVANHDVCLNSADVIRLPRT